MSATSTIPAFCSGLQTALQSKLTTDGVSGLVTLGPPKRGQKLARVWVMIGPDVHDWQQEYRGLPSSGPAAKSESYVVDVLVDVLTAGQDQATVNTAAFNVVAELEKLLRSDVRATWFSGPAGSQLVSCEVRGGKGLKQRATTEDREAAVEVEVLVTARI